MANLKLIRSILQKMCLTYPQPPSSEEDYNVLLQTWVAVLSDVSDEDLKRAALQYLSSHAIWRPAPGQLRAHAVTQGVDLKTRAQEAWLETKEAALFGDEITDPCALKALRNIGGAQAICQCLETELHFLQARFVEVYEMFAEAELRREATALSSGNGYLALGD